MEQRRFNYAILIKGGIVSLAILGLVGVFAISPWFIILVLITFPLMDKETFNTIDRNRPPIYEFTQTSTAPRKIVRVYIDGEENIFEVAFIKHYNFPFQYDLTTTAGHNYTWNDAKRVVIEYPTKEEDPDLYV